MKKISFVMLIVVAALMTSCLSNNGNNSYSYTYTDFADVHTNSSKVAVSALTDDSDEPFYFTNQQQISWMTTPDSTYRAYIQFTYSTDYTTTAIILNGATQAKYLEPQDPTTVSWGTKRDALTLERGILGENEKYINLYLSNCGNDDFYGVVDSVATEEGETVHYLQLCHEDKALSSSTVYASIPLSKIDESDPIYVGIPDGKEYKYYQVRD